jgi:drug/metabolite transporter (DMT)-like permease
MKREFSVFALFITAAIWGFAFVAQRKGMENLDPFMFNGIRFAIGALFVGLIMNRRFSGFKRVPYSLGLALFAGATFQQIGIAGTTAGNAGFITGLYIVFVPILGLFRKQKISKQLVVALSFATIGLYLINDNSDLAVTLSNSFVLIGAVFWAIHLQLIDKMVKVHGFLCLAFSQYAICAALSFAAGLLYNIFFKPEVLSGTLLFSNISKSSIPLLYSGLISVGIAYSLQVYAQKKVEPTKSAIILSLESVFALIGGWWLLKEGLAIEGVIGAALLFIAMIISISIRPEKVVLQIPDES